jgi:hypothetical protein
MRMLGKHYSYPTYYFNKKKTFLSPLSSLLHASSFLNLKKQLSLSSLIQLSSFLTLKEDADKREKEVFMEERKKKIDRQNRKKMETRERGREDGKKKSERIGRWVVRGGRVGGSLK